MKLGRLAVAFALSLPLLSLAAPVPKRTAKDAANQFFNAVEKGKGGNTSVFWHLPEVDVIRELTSHFASENARRRGLAIEVTQMQGHRAKNPAARRIAAEALLKHAVSKSGAEKREVASALHALTKFRKADFPPKGGEAVAKFVREIGPSEAALILAGLLDVKEVTDNLKGLATPVAGQSPFLNPQWSANLALARLGDAAAAKHCVATVAGEKDTAQRTRHFEELAYTRQEVALKGLIEQLKSDELLPALKPNLPGSPLSHYALSVLAETVVDFPVKGSNVHLYTAEQLAAARKWATEKKQPKWKE